jgi:D-lyxose ketol-isomerase
MFAVRNAPSDKRHGDPYCEKMLARDVEQITPTSLHWGESEGIAHRGGSRLAVRAFSSAEDEEPRYLLFSEYPGPG